MKKKFQIAALCVVLVAVIAAGVWFLRPQSAKQDEMPEYDPDAFMQIQAALPSRYTLAREASEDFPIFNAALRELFLYDGQYCTFRLHMDDDVAARKGGDWNDGETLRGMEWSGVDVVSMTSGEVLQSYGADSFYRGGGFQSLAMDRDGTLWAFYWDPSALTACIAPCKPGVSESDAIAVEGLADLPGFTDGIDGINALLRFAARDGRFWLQSNYKLAGIDASGSAEMISGTGQVESFCLDGSGRIFCLNSHLYGGSDELTVYSSGESQRISLGDKISGTFVPYAVSSAESGCYLWGGHAGDSGYIYSFDPETLEFQEQLALHLDTVDLPPALLDNFWAGFAVDDRARLYFNSAYYDYSSDDWADWSAECSTYVLEPVENTVAPEDRITLTITAPYVIDSVTNAMRLYNRAHPEVSLVWDVRYDSREELQANLNEYREQASLRMMVGDMGDLMLLGGAGLDQEVVTKNDAFVDLTGYLESCPFQDELGTALLEPLQGPDGAVRAVPIAVVPRYLIWNMDLLEELGDPVDPDTATWSELLALARQWQEDGVDLSLFTGFGPGALEVVDEETEEMVRAGFENTVLLRILDANLYQSNQNGGNPQVDVSHLGDLLSQLKELKGATALYNRTNSVKRSLLMMPDMSASVFNSLYMIHDVASKNGIRVYLAPMPKGETYSEQLGYALFWGISSWSDQKDAAWDFLQFLISRDGLENDSYRDDTLLWNTAAQDEWLAYKMGFFFEEDDPSRNEFQEYLREIQAIQQQPYSRVNQPTGWEAAAYVPVSRYLQDDITLDEAMEQIKVNWERLWLE